MPGIEKLHLEDALEDSPQVGGVVLLLVFDPNFDGSNPTGLHSHLIVKTLNFDSALFQGHLLRRSKIAVNSACTVYTKSNNQKRRFFH